jgi:membrane protease YdiL (CAAX protease family)
MLTADFHLVEKLTLTPGTLNRKSETGGPAVFLESKRGIGGILFTYMTTDGPFRPRSLPAISWLGLVLALLGMLIIRQAVGFLWPNLPLPAVILREALFWASGAGLILLIRKGERLPLSSIGLGTRGLIKSILWGLVIFVACIVVGGLLAHLLNYGHGPASAAFDKLPLWMVTLVVLRAGVVEELFYRGYAIERLQALGLNRFVAAGIPLIIFGVGHWTGGAANILIALALGAILAGFYLWHRDLVANMIGHFLVDFVANVLPKFFS